MRELLSVEPTCEEIAGAGRHRHSSESHQRNRLATTPTSAEETIPGSVAIQSYGQTGIIGKSSLTGLCREADNACE